MTCCQMKKERNTTRDAGATSATFACMVEQEGASRLFFARCRRVERMKVELLPVCVCRHDIRRPDELDGTEKTAVGRLESFTVV